VPPCLMRWLICRNEVHNVKLQGAACELGDNQVTQVRRIK
jgi:hypothetical protein